MAAFDHNQAANRNTVAATPVTPNPHCVSKIKAYAT
jgi:hypothetical protein